MFESIGNFFKKIVKPENKELGSKDSAKERLHLVLMQDRANVSADFLELMKQEIIDVIKKYIVVDEDAIDVRLTNKVNEDGTNGAPSLYANIPIINIKNEMKAEKINDGELKENNENSNTEDKDAVREDNTVKNDKDNKKEEDKIEEKQKKAEKKSSSKKAKKDVEKKEAEKECEELDLELENDEEDDDVTFDDLLRAAEEADREKVSKE